MYPRIVIKTTKFEHNLRYLQELFSENELSLMAVTKVFCADKRLVQILINNNVDFIADSRIKNLKSMETDVPKVLLRLPMISEVREVVKYADISLNSELRTIDALNGAAFEERKTHGIILMIDLGDLREGIFDISEAKKIVNEVINMEHLHIIGIGTNLTCYGGIIPSREVLQKLVDLKDELEEIYMSEIDIVSGGNSSSLKLLLDNKLPSGISNLRIGEALVLGRETAYGKKVKNLHDDIFTLEVEVIELKEKPSLPIGEVGMDAFGKIPVIEDKGIMKRAILAIGKQDVDYKELIPLQNIEFLGSSSDHLIIDVSKEPSIKVGSILKFKLTYASLLSLMTSQYVERKYE